MSPILAAPVPRIADDAIRLHAMWKSGRLGGETMPEDVHPRLDRSSHQLAAYFTLGMALNYWLMPSGRRKSSRRPSPGVGFVSRSRKLRIIRA